MKFSCPLVGIVGWSGSGKTTLLEKLIPVLCKRGLRINVIKSSHHDVEIEPPGKDSARIRAAGASEVILSSPFRYMLAHELCGEAMPPLADLVARMQPADLILVEGYRDAAIPKLEVFRPSLGKPALYPDDVYVVAVASDVACPDVLPEKLAWLDLNDSQKICDWISGQPHNI